MSFVRAGDTLVVHSMDHLPRNLDDLRTIVQNLAQRGGYGIFKRKTLPFRMDCPIAILIFQRSNYRSSPR